MLWSPTIRAALIAGTPWLDVFCPGCGTSRAIDLRTVDRHPLAAVGTMVLGLRCSWCPGWAPMPKLLGLHALPLPIYVIFFGTIAFTIFFPSVILWLHGQRGDDRHEDDDGRDRFDEIADYRED